MICKHCSEAREDHCEECDACPEIHAYWCSREEG